MTNTTADMNHERRISLLEQANGQARATMEAANTKLDMILVQITRVAVLEEKHQSQQTDVLRAHERIGTAEATVNTLAIETRAFINYSQGRDKVLWAIGAVVMALLIKSLFFAASHGMTP